MKNPTASTNEPTKQNADTDKATDKITENKKVAFITGAAKRVGANIARLLHNQGYNLVLHYRYSVTDAQSLADSLNIVRPNSVKLVSADLNDMNEVEALAHDVLQCWGCVDVLINNASSFYPTPLASSTQAQWDDLINSNLRAPYFLCAALGASLTERQGCIINLVDIHAQRGLPDHPIYSIAKAGLQMLTMSLAKELAPHVRVNGVSPGAILWPESNMGGENMSEESKQAILDKTLLKRIGSADDLAQAVLYFCNAPYVTGQILSVDGGKSLFSH